MTFAGLMQVLADIATFIGLPIGVIILYKEFEKQRREREYGTYNSLDDKYIEFLSLCAQYPELRMFYNVTEKSRHTEEEKIQKQILFEILFSIFERAFLLYRDSRPELRQSQFSGWESYIRAWSQRRDFVDAWAMLGDQYDTDFVAEMKKYISRT